MTGRTLTIGVQLLWVLGGVAVLATAGLLDIAVAAALRADRELQETYVVIHRRA